METDITDYTEDIPEQIPEEKPTFDPELLDSLVLQQQMQADLPLTEMESPYKKPRRRCVLCKYNVDLDYKNTQLLSQFTSPYTGRIYGRHITGLCIPMQRRISQLIQRSRKAGFMPFLLKETVYLNDPKLFDPFKPGNQKKYH
ncbi:small ribosomal subunit protein bS18m-like isoform X2 [Liolophura sinensis]